MGFNGVVVSKSVLEFVSIPKEINGNSFFKVFLFPNLGNNLGKPQTVLVVLNCI